MEKSTLVPFLRVNLEILFVGINPAKGSSDKGHYFSVNQAFWNQLFASGLINNHVDKNIADNVVFGDTIINCNRWNFGITDLVTQFAESDSVKITPTKSDCIRLKMQILDYKPKVVVLLHKKVLDYFLPFLGKPVAKSNSGYLGRLLIDCEIEFYNIAFPHGNSISSRLKIKNYIEIQKLIADKIKDSKT